MIHRVAPESTLRTDSGLRAANFEEEVAQEVALPRAELSKSSAFRTGEEPIGQRQAGPGALEDSAIAAASDDAGDRLSVERLDYGFVAVRVRNAICEMGRDALVVFR